MLVKCFFVRVACWCIIAPTVPFYVLAMLGEALAHFAERMAQKRRWALYLWRKMDRFAARHGVDL